MRRYINAGCTLTLVVQQRWLYINAGCTATLAVQQRVIITHCIIEVSEFLLHDKNTIFDDLSAKKSLKSMVLA